MLFPCLQKQQRSVNPQDQTEKMHHLDESDVQMWNRSKLNFKSVTNLFDFPHVGLSLTSHLQILYAWFCKSESDFCILFFFLCRRTLHLSNHRNIAFAQMSFLNPLFPNLSSTNSIMGWGGGDIFGEHNNLVLPEHIATLPTYVPWFLFHISCS